MKKLLMTLGVLCAFTMANAQDDIAECFNFFPHTPGTKLVNKTYDAKGTLLATTTFNIEKSSENQSGFDTQIRTAVTDSLNNTVDKGYIEISCDNGSFVMKQAYSPMCPELMNTLSMNTELLGDFMDYPDTYNDDYPLVSGFKKDGGQLILQSKDNKDALVKIRIFNRQHQSNEKITTPANTFNASKIVFDFEVTKDNKTTHYKGVEWYAKDAGIVRSETRDENNNLLNYTELAALTSN